MSPTAARCAVAAIALAAAGIAGGADTATTLAGAAHGAIERNAVSIALENDYFADSDDGYTGGFLLHWTSSEDRSAGIGSRGPDRIGLALGQAVFTPSDIRRPHAPPDDRAWAGWLFLAASRSDVRGRWAHLREVSAGIVGPSSGGGGLQRGLHRTVGGVTPAGWHTQIDDTATLQLTWRVRTRLDLRGPGSTALALSPEAGVSVGNAQRHADLGATLDLGSAAGGARTGAWRVDLALRVRGVAHDLLLEERGGAPGRLVVEPWVGELSLGAAWRFGNAELAYRHVLRTRQFETQREGDRYGSVRVTLFR